MLPVTIQELVLGLLDAVVVGCFICSFLAPMRAHAILGVVPIAVVVAAFAWCSNSGMDVGRIFTLPISLACLLSSLTFAWMRLAESFASMKMLEAIEYVSGSVLSVAGEALKRGIRTPAALAVLLYDAGLVSSIDSVWIARRARHEWLMMRMLVAIAALSALLCVASLFVMRYELAFFGAGLAIFLISVAWRARTISQRNGRLIYFPAPGFRKLLILIFGFALLTAFHRWTEDFFSLTKGNVVFLAALFIVGPILLNLAKGRNAFVADDDTPTDAGGQQQGDHVA